MVENSQNILMHFTLFLKESISCAKRAAGGLVELVRQVSNETYRYAYIGTHMHTYITTYIGTY